MSDKAQSARLVILILSILLLLIAGFFFANVLQSGLGVLLILSSAIAFACALVAVVYSYNSFQKAKNAG